MDPGTSSSSQTLTDFHEPTSHDQSDMQYDEAFPALPPNPSGPNSGPTSGLSSPGASSKWTRKMRIGSNTVTSVFHIPYEERSDRSHGASFGEMDALKTCAEISKDIGAHIEMSNSRDQSLTFLITGKQSAVLEAKRAILAAFQTQAQVQVSIPKEHHRFILGKQGANLNELETQTATKITVPRTNEDSLLITVQGTREGIEKAVHKIRLLSDEKSKQASERLSIPKKFHPFICGANNSKVRALESENVGMRINVPPPSVMSDEIYITGEKEGVARAVEAIKQYHEECKRYAQISVEVGKAQHRYIIGPKRSTINEIFASTGVMVEIPPNDQPSETVTLRGPTDALGTALNLVYEKANSVITRTVDAPAWIHKYIIGKKGANIRQITIGQGYNNVRVDVKESDKESQIVIEGPPEEVEPVKEQFQACVNDLIENKYFQDIQVDPKYHKHIIGKNGANVNRLKEETGVIISVPDNQSSIIHLEGLRSGVEAAAAKLLEQVEKLEGEKERDLIIEHRFHGNIIGARGESIRDVRDKFNQVQITFPAPGEKRDVVTVRGPKDDVDACCKHLNQVYKELLDSSYQLKVPVFPQCYRIVVGKGGQNIKKIREDTKTRFDLPPLEEGKNKSEPEIIVITGKKENCEAARDRILEIQNSQANVVEIDVMIPNKYHNVLIGSRGKLVQSISEDCGGVHIKFPDSKTKSDRVTVIGPKEDVEKAKGVLLEMTRDKEINSYTETLDAKSQHHRFLIGKNGSNIRKIRESTNTRIIFPNEGDPDVITIIGKKDGVIEAKRQIQEVLKDLDKVVESEMDVDPQHHRHFVLRRGEVLRRISDELGGVQISFPKANSNSARVTLKGAAECVEAAKKRIAQIVDDLNNRITVDVIIEQKHHRTIMGKGGSKVQQIQSDFNVEIKFPDRNDDPDFVSEENDEGIKYSDIIRLTGRPENCEGAKQALLEQVPVAVEVDIPFDMHRFIIGQKGKDVRELMRMYDVNITVPPSTLCSNTIVIVGSPKSAAAAKEALLEKRNELEVVKAEKELRSFEVKIQVDAEFHPKIIGKGGAVITNIRKNFDVNIQLPKKDDPDDDVITIIGLEENALQAKEEIMKIVNELSGRVSEDVEIDHRVHSRIIGSRGKNVREIMKEYGVEIRFPRSTEGSNPNLVSISGNDIDRIYDARDHLLNLEEEYIQDVTENEYMQQFVRDGNQGKETGKKEKQSNGFVVKGAPWEQPPDTQSNEEFPSFGIGVASNDSSMSRPLSSVWGPRKHF